MGIVSATSGPGDGCHRAESGVPGSAAAGATAIEAAPGPSCARLTPSATADTGLPLALRAVPIAAGVVAIDLPLTVTTLRELTAEVRSPTRREIPQDARVTGEQTVPDVGAIRRAVLADDLRHLQHDDL